MTVVEHLGVLQHTILCSKHQPPKSDTVVTADRPCADFAKTDGEDLLMQARRSNTSIAWLEAQADMDDCHVCGGADSLENNRIIYCDQCNVGVHQTCYGVDIIPDGYWFCAHCKAQRTQNTVIKRQCLACPLQVGALKQTVDGRWAHVICAISVPHISFDEPTNLEKIRVDARATSVQRRCSICGLQVGFCIQCTAAHCGTTYHASCALLYGLYLNFEDRGHNGALDVRFVSYCHKHSTIKRNKQHQDRTSHGHVRRLSSKQLHESSLIQLAQARQLFPSTPRDTLRLVVQYWQDKRSRLECFLLGRLRVDSNTFMSHLDRWSTPEELQRALVSFMT